MRDTIYRYLYPLTPIPNVPTMLDVGILSDGTLHNPNGYPEDVVRTAVLAADERRRLRRSKGAKKAAATRARRQAIKLNEMVRKLSLGHKYGPSQICEFCDQPLTDPQSIERGIGSDCWQKIMAKLTEWQEQNLEKTK
jgi:Family of unknown function (DUF6011)